MVNAVNETEDAWVEDVLRLETMANIRVFKLEE
jgi:hypothetical protein